MFLPLREPVLEGGHTFGKFPAAGEEADAVLVHPLLTDRLVAQVDTPTDMTGPIRRRAMDASIIKKDGGARLDRQCHSMAVGLFLQGDFGVAGASVALAVIFDETGFVSARPDVEATVHFVGVDQRNPNRDDRIPVRVGPIGAILMPRHRPGGHAGHFGPGVVDGIGENLTPD